MFQDTFKTVVIGSDILAYLIATELTLKKEKVCLIIPSTERPSNLYLRHFSEVQKFLSQIGISRFESFAFTQKPSCFQIISKNMRFDCHTKNKDFRFEFERELKRPTTMEEVQQFLTPPPTLFKKRIYKNVIKTFEKKEYWAQKLSYPFAPLPYLQNFFLFQKDGTFISKDKHVRLIKKLRMNLEKAGGIIKETDILKFTKTFERWILNTKAHEGTLFCNQIISTSPLNTIQYNKRKIRRFRRRGEYLPLYSSSFYFKANKKPVGLKQHFSFIEDLKKKSLADNVWNASLKDNKHECRIDVTFSSYKPQETITLINDSLHKLIPFSRIERESKIIKHPHFYHSFTCERNYNPRLCKIDRNWYHFGGEVGAWQGLSTQIKLWKDFTNE